jgi:hypothetical protein
LDSDLSSGRPVTSGASAPIGAHSAAVGIAGVNTRPLMRAADPMVGIAGNWGSTLRPHVVRLTKPGASISKSRIGDQAALHAPKRACHFLDYTYVACPDRGTGHMRYRPGFSDFCAPVTRRLPVYLDSAAYREFTGGAPSWSDYARYCETIDLVHPDGAMAKDVVGDQESSRQGYERMCADGYRDITIPVWQIMSNWVNGLSVEANAHLASHDPVLRHYCDRAPLVAIGGLNQSPCQRSERHLYLQVLCLAFPDTQFWGLGQANPVVVNGLGCAGLLDRVWVDGSWWIHDARAEVLAVLEDGLIKTIRLTRTGARSFFPLLDLMGCNLRSLLSAYAGLWTFPGPARVPTDLEDLDARLELRRRLTSVQLDLFAPLDARGTPDAAPSAAAVA